MAVGAVRGSGARRKEEVVGFRAAKPYEAEARLGKVQTTVGAHREAEPLRASRLYAIVQQHMAAVVNDAVIEFVSAALPIVLWSQHDVIT